MVREVGEQRPRPRLIRWLKWPDLREQKGFPFYHRREGSSLKIDFKKTAKACTYARLTAAVSLTKKLQNHRPVVVWSQRMSSV